mmetsp:Transcript_117428/g.328741  ORF Transcript_117428/g.328741 Transcript_117428/m.328741 type:complete len:220 (+) Transcript_117428:229-888(+)
MLGCSSPPCTLACCQRCEECRHHANGAVAECPRSAASIEFGAPMRPCEDPPTSARSMRTERRRVAPSATCARPRKGRALPTSACRRQTSGCTPGAGSGAGTAGGKLPGCDERAAHRCCPAASRSSSCGRRSAPTMNRSPVPLQGGPCTCPCHPVAAAAASPKPACAICAAPSFSSAPARTVAPDSRRLSTSCCRRSECEWAARTRTRRRDCETARRMGA